MYMAEKSRLFLVREGRDGKWWHDDDDDNDGVE